MSMQTNKENLIVQLSFEFTLLIVDFTTELSGLRQYSLANQLFRAGTSIGANIREAQNAESKADFIHKMKLAAKEADETDYWLLLCKHSDKLPDSSHLLSKLESIQKVLSKIIASSKKDPSSNHQITKSLNQPWL
jgi:four helix bundle protein